MKGTPAVIVSQNLGIGFTLYFVSLKKIAGCCQKCTGKIHEAGNLGLDSKFVCICHNVRPEMRKKTWNFFSHLDKNKGHKLTNVLYFATVLISIPGLPDILISKQWQNAK